jgi:hypothetical protein
MTYRKKYCHYCIIRVIPGTHHAHNYLNSLSIPPIHSSHCFPVDSRSSFCTNGNVLRLIYGGKEIVRLNKSLKNERAEELDEYAVLKNKLDKYFLPKKNKHHARYTFLRMKQGREEKIGSYVSRLREKANDCL